MEIFENVLDQVSRIVAKEFFNDVETFTNDLSKDILLKLSRFDKREQLEVLAKVMVTLCAINLTRFCCLFEDDCQAKIWDEMKAQGLLDAPEYRKAYYGDANENHD